MATAARKKASKNGVPKHDEVGHRQIEAWLHEHGVTEFEYTPKLALSRIDTKASRSNQARPLNPIDEEWVLILAEAAQREKDDFPPLVVEKRGNSTKVKILDGNHRHAAWQLLDLSTIPAYIITQQLTETQERMLAYTGNLRHGLSVDMDTRVRHAQWLHEARGMTIAAAAQAVGAPMRRVQARVALEQATRRVEAVDRRAATKLGTGVRTRLDNIRSDVVHGELTRLALETNMSQSEISPIVTAVNKHRTEQEQLAVIENERKRRIAEIQAGAGGKVPMPLMLRNTRAALSRIIRIDLEELGNTEADPAVKKQIKLQATEAMRKLSDLINAL